MTQAEEFVARYNALRADRKGSGRTLARRIDPARDWTQTGRGAKVVFSDGSKARLTFPSYYGEGRVKQTSRNKAKVV